MTDAPHSLLRSWQQHSRAGLTASLAHQPALALAHHAHAVRHAQALLGLPDGAVSDDDRCAAFVVGHLNLADTLAELDMPAQARQSLLDAAAQLQAWMDEPARVAGASLLAGRHLHHLLAALVHLPAQPTAAVHAALAPNACIASEGRSTPVSLTQSPLPAAPWLH